MNEFIYIIKTRSKNLLNKFFKPVRTKILNKIMSYEEAFDYTTLKDETKESHQNAKDHRSILRDVVVGVIVSLIVLIMSYIFTKIF